MTYAPVEVIEVWAWGQFVGAVAQNPESGFFAFQYDPAWVRRGTELAPIHLPVREDPYEFRNLDPGTFLRLPPMLADALPDAFGNALVDAWMAERGIDGDEITPLDRLAYAADRSMGALEFAPPAPRPADPPTAISLADLVVGARKTVSGDLAGDGAAHDSIRQLIQVGTSAGGARAKAVVAFHPETYQMGSAYVDLVEGFEHWLIKLDGVDETRSLDGRTNPLGASAPYGRIEFAYSEMAVAAGITMERCLLLAEGPRRHFMTRRFDRTSNGAKRHVQSLCAMAHLDFNQAGAHSYDQYLQTIRQLGMSPEALGEGFRRMVFNVAAVNCDDHTKNLSFLLGEHDAWELAPAFDVTFAHSSTGQWTQQHQMSVNGKRGDDITIADLHEVGDRNDVPGYRGIVREVLAAVDRWPEFAETADVDGAEVTAISREMHRFRPR